MSAQHTPGPWYVFSTIVPANSPHGVEVAAGTNYRGDGPEKTVGRMFGFSDADKTLAMAAPELLAALEQIERAPAWGAPDRWETTPAEVRQLARAAIAKAEGRS